MILNNVLFVGLALLLGSILQGAVGFAFGLFVIPILVWIGLDLSEAVALVSMSIFIQVIVGAYQLRADIRWREVLLATAIRYLTIPIGIAILLTIDTLDKTRVKQFLGGLLLLALLIQTFVKVQPRDHLHPRWMLVAFSSSGVMHGMAAMGGPPVVLWVMAHRWSNRESRAFLQALFLLAAPLQVGLLYFSAESNMAGAILTGLLSAPLVALGAVIGVRLGDLFSRPRLRQAALAILYVTALASLFAPS